MSGVYTSSGYHNRRSIRLRGYDYSKPGAYFITICIDDYKCRFFGDVTDGLVRLNEFGTIVGQCWNDLAGHYANIRLDEFVIMPNHVHGIIIIREPITGRDDKSIFNVRRYIRNNPQNYHTHESHQ